MRWNIAIKGCQRCGGDIYLESDQYGTYITCLQCGAIKDAEATPALVGSTAPSRGLLQEEVDAA